jgi:hypothetical protein
VCCGAVLFQAVKVDGGESDYDRKDSSIHLN